MTSPDDMQNRIDRLEGLVLSLMTNGSQSAGPAAAAAAIASMNLPSNPQSHQGSISSTSTTMDATLEVDAPEPIKEEQGSTAHDDSDVEQVAKSIGVMKVDNNKTIFASEAHWYAILGEVRHHFVVNTALFCSLHCMQIAEVKTYFNEHKKQYEEQLRRHQTAYTDEISPGTAFLFGSVQPAEKSELMAAFPTKTVADLLITRYFNVYDPGFRKFILQLLIGC